MTTPPGQMLAIDPEGAGGPEVLIPVERPIPSPGPDEVLVRVEAAGVNRADILQRKGLYPPPSGAPTILGLEAAGVVVAEGANVGQALVGQRVCALLPGGGYAGYCSVPAALCLPLPDGLSMTDAAALPEALFTVWTNLFQRACVADGDAVLVHGGTSGIGTMAIMLGRLFGLEVLVTAGSDDKCRRAIEIGAAHAINYRDADFVEEVRRLTSGRGVAAVLDMVGGDYVPRNLACLSTEGRHVSIATQRGTKAEISFLDLMQRRLTLTGSTLRGRSVAFKSAVTDELVRTVWPHVVAGELRPVVDSIFPLAEAASAHRRMESGEHVGKVVLQIG